MKFSHLVYAVRSTLKWSGHKSKIPPRPITTAIYRRWKTEKIYTQDYNIEIILSGPVLRAKLTVRFADRNGFRIRRTLARGALALPSCRMLGPLPEIGLKSSERISSTRPSVRPSFRFIIWWFPFSIFWCAWPTSPFVPRHRTFRWLRGQGSKIEYPIDRCFSHLKTMFLFIFFAFQWLFIYKIKIPF